ncbi:hypothetical protein EII21_11660, partial [Conchiformibius steedae]
TQENVSFTHVDSDSISIGNGNNADGSKPIVTLTSDNGALKVANKNNEAVKITNVAPAELSENSKDAVNGSQLYSLGDSVTNIFGGNTTFNPADGKGKVEGFKFQVTKEGNTVPHGDEAQNVYDALGNLNKYINAGIKIGNNEGTKISDLTPTEQLNFVDGDNVS